MTLIQVDKDTNYIYTRAHFISISCVFHHVGSTHKTNFFYDDDDNDGGGVNRFDSIDIGYIDCNQLIIFIRGKDEQTIIVIDC